MLTLSTLALLFGFLLDLLLGDPRGFPHIVVGMGKTIAALEKVLRALLPKTPGGERAGGVLLVVLTILIGAGLPLLVLVITYHFAPLLGMVVESFLCWQLFAAKDLEKESMAVYGKLKEHDLPGAQLAVSMIVGRDTKGLDEAGVAKAAVETVAENTSDGVVAPIFYCMLGGAVFGCLYKAVNTMDSMVGYRNERYLDFGRAAAKLDDCMSYLPARLAAQLMILTSGLVGLDGRNARRIYRRDRRNHASPNSAHTEAVCAGALNVRLAGDAYYFGKLHEKPFIGDDMRPIEPEDIPRANRLMYAAALSMLILALMVRVILIGGLYLCDTTSTAVTFSLTGMSSLIFL
ncbi:MAG: cobalamin biosynthesis protein CobD [Actinobacteria bacterium]|nr:cobalamin biosynthesis protein CobD [Actinomycetota bacterium]